MNVMKIVGVIVCSCYLSGCTSDIASAPVVNGWHQPAAASQEYVVRSGDTLYSVAWAFGLDYRSLAQANHLQPPYAIKAGQRLKMTAQSSGSTQQGTYQKESYDAGRVTPSVVTTSNQFNQPVSHWLWPTQGSLVSKFSLSAKGYSGVEIAGHLGQPVSAAAAGEVVYSGMGVRGYGNLIIIKHNNSYLSAYAFNQKRLVAVGQEVVPGQEIALMGQNNAGKTLLYFEIRKDGKPVDPLRYLG
jgi:lipoprotein NlpD